jgi:hypothetical protein
MNASTSMPADQQGHSGPWQLDADQQQIVHLRQLLHEQTSQLAELQASGALPQSLEIVQHLITLYERALREAEEQAIFHQKTL